MSKNLYLNFLFQFFAWMLFFQATRLVFVLWNYQAFMALPIDDILLLPIKALSKDFAMTCYFMIVPFLLFSLALFFEKKVFLQLNRYYHVVLIAFVSILTIAELPIYDEWHTKLNYTAFRVLFTNPVEVHQTASNNQLVFTFLSSALLAIGGILLFKKMVSIEVSFSPISSRSKLIFLFISPVLMVLGIGTDKNIPIKGRNKAYAQQNVLSIAAANSTFNLLNSCVNTVKNSNSYHFMSDEEANKLFVGLTKAERDSTTNILTIEKPNILLVILESWSGDLVKSCGGYEGITPNMEKLIQDGLFFNNCYASGYLSDQGMGALFSAFPAQTQTSIIKEYPKYEHLPCINQELEEKGYHSSFLFGGHLSYGNIRAYLDFHGFDRILEGKDFKDSIPQGALGVADQYLFDRQLVELSKEKAPFFAAMFTLSSHSPFDFPMEEKLHWGGKEKKYINSVLYADDCLGDFMEKAKQKEWYKNTLFIFISDHSHNSPKNWAATQHEYRKIPFLLYGEVLKPEYRGTKISFVASQTDFAATLLGQLGISSHRYPYSKNLFNPYSPHNAFFAFDDGFCFVKPEGYLSWHVADGRIDFDKVDKPQDKAKMVKEGQAILQRLMGDYYRY